VHVLMFSFRTEVHGCRNKLGVCLSGSVGDCFFSPSDISGLKSPKNVKFDTKVASSMRMMCPLRFLEKVL